MQSKKKKKQSKTWEQSKMISKLHLKQKYEVLKPKRQS